jgi:hypothetical protein
MAFWKPLTIQGEEIDLSHLEAFYFNLHLPVLEREVSVNVTFHNHCFSEELKSQNSELELPATHSSGKERRVFDPLRYELSLLLPEIIKQFKGKRIAQTREGSFVKVSLESGYEYAVFFGLTKVEASVCRLTVISAYPLNTGRKAVIVATGEMRFEVAVGKVMQGQKPKFPPRIKTSW